MQLVKYLIKIIIIIFYTTNEIKNTSNYNFFVDIIIPLSSAIISGIITILGIYITIKYEEKKYKKEIESREEERKEEIKIKNEPLFYILDSMQDYDYKSAVEFDFISNERKNGRQQIIFKNTDKIQIILNYISINNKKYYPSNGTVVDKNVIFYINIYSCENPINEEKNDIYLSVNDVLNNEYKYEIKFSKENNKFLTGIMNKK